MDSVTVQIDAPPERLYDLVADITKMGRWSPECYKCRWLGSATRAATGARFLGFNKQGWVRWATLCTVVSADPGREFAFKVSPTSTVWRYRFEAAGDGTAVTETRELTGQPILVKAANLVIRNHEQLLVEGMHQTLARLKAAAEQS